MMIYLRNRDSFIHANVLAVAMLLVLGSHSVIAQDYETSVVGTDFDFITESDPSTFVELEFVREGQAEMPDKRDERAKLHQPAYVFKATFNDGTMVQLFLAAKFGSREVAEAEAKRYVHPLGKLPTALRRGVKRLVVHEEGDDTTAFSDEGLIVIYAGNATRRIATHDLEETTFHESVHAAWDAKHAKSDTWQRAQAADGNFVTLYAKRKPQGEDLAETALFAYTLLHHPDRIPDADRQRIKLSIPNRIMYIAELLPPDQPIHYAVEKADSKKSGKR